jgi:hypothetical protein
MLKRIREQKGNIKGTPYIPMNRQVCPLLDFLFILSCFFLQFILYFVALFPGMITFIVMISITMAIPIIVIEIVTITILVAMSDLNYCGDTDYCAAIAIEMIPILVTMPIVVMILITVATPIIIPQLQL